ncbi:PAS domain-containing protein [Methylobacterium sp. WL9]|nr:PAS domain-containing protein [Methylobacterium sp. WL9]
MHARDHLRDIGDGAIDVAVVVTDLDGVVTDWNATAERIFGVRREEILGEHIERLHRRGPGRRPDRLRDAYGSRGGAGERRALAPPEGRIPVLGVGRDDVPARRGRSTRGLRQARSRLHPPA